MIIRAGENISPKEIEDVVYRSGMVERANFFKNVLFSCIPSGSYLSPFYAVKEYDLTRGNYGGIETNLAGEVTDKDGNAIPGLYAAGIISSAGFFGDYYPGREAFGVGAYMGFISGENAAKYAAK